MYVAKNHQKYINTPNAMYIVIDIYAGGVFLCQYIFVSVSKIIKGIVKKI